MHNKCLILKIFELQFRGESFEAETCNKQACPAPEGLCPQRYLTMCDEEFCVK